MSHPTSVHDLDWWRFWPLAEGTKRPVAWSQSSVIFSAHPTQPTVVARRFPSSQPVLVPTPTTILTASTTYLPPTIISASLDDLWLFAYFPAISADGVACLWHRGRELNHWEERESWLCGRGAGVMAASWIGGPREWITPHQGSSKRLPLRGPRWSLSSFALLLVMQNNEVHLCFYRPNQSSISIVRSSLSEQHFTSEHLPTGNNLDLFGETNSAAGARICTHAAIGLGYDENVALVATRSQTVPTAIRATPGYMHMDLSQSFVGMPPNSIVTDAALVDWENWGEENHIELCEVRIIVDSRRFDVGLAMNPILPLSLGDRHITHLQFICSPSETIANPSSGFTSKSPSKAPIKHVVHLVASSTKFDFISPPRSEVSLFKFARRISPENMAAPSWITSLTSTRVFESEVVVSLTCCSPHILANPAIVAQSEAALKTEIVAVGLVSTSFDDRQLDQKKKKKLQLGVLKILSLLSSQWYFEVDTLSDASRRDLGDDPSWESSPIMASTNHDSLSVPLGAALSPNGMVLCMENHSNTEANHSILCPFPWPRDHDKSATFVAAIRNSIQSSNSPADIIQRLIGSSELTEIEDVLSSALATPSPETNSLDTAWTSKVLGVAIDVYRARDVPNSPLSVKNGLAARWKLAQEICSLVSSIAVFEDYQETDDRYDLDAVWQLIAICSWFVESLERLIKDCIWREEKKSESNDGIKIKVEPGVKVEEFNTTTAPSAVLHVIHPFSLQMLQAAVVHVRRFRDQVMKSSTNNSKARIAKQLLADLFGASGVNLDKLQEQLQELSQATKGVDESVLRASLAACKPNAGLSSQCKAAIEKLASSPAVDTTRLFLKISDFVDGFSELSISNPTEIERDIVTKVNLANPAASILCARCGGKSAGVPRPGGSIPVTWKTCVCNGEWVLRTL